MIVDLLDDRRAAKPWLTQNEGRDVSDGFVVLDEYGKPSCIKHGAMNRVDPVVRVYRCLAIRCGVGAEHVL